MNRDELEQRLIEWLIAGDISAQEQIITNYTEAISYVADFLIRKGVTIRERGEWIPVTERLPEEIGRYLTANKRWGDKIGVFDLWFDGVFWFIDEEDDVVDFEVTHWMPLPDPPETEKDGAE